MLLKNITDFLTHYCSLLNKLLTIITVTFNCKDVITPTLESILRHKDPALEYIVVDGASGDGTLEILKQYGDQIDLLISEPDSGIYDAMNKGLEASTGEFVLFINAGDIIYNADVVPGLLDLLMQGRADVYYGDAMLIDNTGRELGLRSVESSRALPEDLNWKSLERGMVVCHQSFVARRSIAPNYNLKYQSSADIDWVISCLKRASSIINTDLTISGYLTGGYSKQSHQTSLKERFSILSHHYGWPKTVLNHLIILLRGLMFKLKGKNLN